MRLIALLAFSLVLNGATAKAAEPYGLDAMISRYLDAHTRLAAIEATGRADDGLDAMIALANKGNALADISRHVFRDPLSPEYVTALRQVDQAFQRSPEAIYDLGRGLQLKWEAMYADLLLNRRKFRSDAGGTAGVGLGAAIALGAVLYKTAAAAPAYFNVIRSAIPLLPLAGHAAGTGAGAVINRVAKLDRDIPAAPAHIMRLGLSESRNTDDSERILRESLVSLLSSAIATGVTSWATPLLTSVRWLNVSLTPAKINPFVLAASILVFTSIDAAGHAALRSYDHHHFMTLVSESRGRLLELRDPLLLYQEAHHLVSLCSTWMATESREMFEAFKSDGNEIRLARKLNKLVSSRAFAQTEAGIREAAASLRATETRYLSSDADYLDALVTRVRAAAEAFKGATK